VVGEGIFVAVLVDVGVIVGGAVKVGDNCSVLVEDEIKVFEISVGLFENGLQATISNRITDVRTFNKR
jgi:hypothetical protein